MTACKYYKQTPDDLMKVKSHCEGFVTELCIYQHDTDGSKLQTVKSHLAAALSVFLAPQVSGGTRSFKFLCTNIFISSKGLQKGTPLSPERINGLRASPPTLGALFSSFGGVKRARA